MPGDKQTQNNDRDEGAIGKGKPGPGRPKGSANKHTALLKDAILKAAELAGGGGEEGTVNYLKKQATEQPVAFMGLLGKVLPTEIGGKDGGPIEVKILRFADADPSE